MTSTEIPWSTAVAEPNEGQKTREVKEDNG